VIHTFSHLCRVLREKAPTRACGRAIDEGVVHALGGFTASQRFGPGWAAQIRGTRGQTWVLFLEALKAPPWYRLHQFATIDELPWSSWEGCKPGATDRHRLYAGDFPDHARHLKATADQARPRHEAPSGRPADQLDAGPLGHPGDGEDPEPLGNSGIRGRRLQVVRERTPGRPYVTTKEWANEFLCYLDNLGRLQRYRVE
jgi:hypothetical protein